MRRRRAILLSKPDLIPPEQVEVQQMRLVRGHDDLTGAPRACAQKVLEVFVNEHWMQTAVDLINEIHGLPRLQLINSGDQVQKTSCAVRLLRQRQRALLMMRGLVSRLNRNTIEALAVRGTLHQQL